MVKDNKKGIKTYAIMGIIVIVTVLVVIGLLEMAKAQYKARPRGESNKTTSSTTMPTNIKPSLTPSEVSTLNVSLEQIIDGYVFLNDYAEEIVYQNAVFNFNCTKYQEENNTCQSGSGLMRINNTLIPLYTYDDNQDNYLLHPEDYYIIVDANYIVLVQNYVGKKTGEAKFYNRQGEYLFNVTDVMTGYKLDKRLIARLYPNITKDNFYFYQCENNQVYIKSLNLANRRTIKMHEHIANAVCY